MFLKPNTTARILTSLLLALAIPHQLQAAGPAPLNLLSNTNFVVLAETQITEADTTGSINGNIGLSGTGTGIHVTCAQVTGTIYAVDASGPLPCAVNNATLVNQAVSDMLTSYTDAANRIPVPTGPNLNPGVAYSSGYNIGGMTLPPGLYKFGIGKTAFINTDVTLSGSASDVWIFQCGADLQVATGVHIILAGGANANNIFWQVSSAAVLDTTSVFNGTILAGTSITMNTGSTMNGRALAQAQVTFDGTGAALPVTAPLIVVQQPAGTSLVNNAATNNFGSVVVGTNTSHIFTITNNGSANLTVSGITIDGVNLAMFTVTNLIATVSPGGSTNFTVRFTPGSTGLKTAALHIASNDPTNGLFNIVLTGTGTNGVIIVSTNVLVIATSPIRLDPQTGLFTNSVLVINNSPNTNPAVRLNILNLLTNVQVYYASGTPPNGPYVQYNFPIAPGATVNFTIEYYQASRQGIPLPDYVPQETTPVTLTSTTNSPVARYIRASGGGYLIGFYTTPGRSYAVQYSSDMTNWLTADPLIKAPINYVQWIDFGAPKTQDPLPLTRFYRVFEQP